MKKNLITFLLLFPVVIFAQDTLSISSYETISDDLLNIHNSQYFIDNPYENHLIVDQVNAYTLDSTFTRKTERHRVVGGGLIRMLGFRWKSVDQSRHKFVGWVNKHYLHDIDKKALFTEYDINYDLIPSLPHYIDLSYDTYQEQLGMKKSGKKKQKDQVPYIYPTEDSDMTKYRFHCENTPAVDFRSLLNTVFFPVHRNNDLGKHPNFENQHPVMGMYGVLVLDCNHTCHPEIHPYEWIWWLNLTEEKTSWNVGFLRDVSNRFKHWSSAPRTGEISIPFNFPLDSKNWTINVDHQMFGNFSEEGFAALAIDESYSTFENLNKEFAIQDFAEKSIVVKSNMKIPYTSIQYKIAELNVDETNRVLTGEFRIAMSINEVYTTEVSFDFEEEDLVSDYDQLLEFMQGSFSSKIQAESDTDYYDISLHMYPVWESIDKGWFYVEQAVSSTPDKPYRQRFYKVEMIDHATFKSVIYTLPEDMDAAGKWKDLSYFSNWTPDDLMVKEGCAVYIKKTGLDKFEGATLNGTCLSNFRGAIYATSEVVINESGIDSWDRGFNEDGSQVWGAEKGAYEFR